MLVEVENDDVQSEIIQAALQGKAFRSAGEAVRQVNIFSNGDEKAVLVSHSPLGSLVAISPALVVTDFKSGETYQLSLFGEAVSLPPRNGRRR